MLPLPRSIQEMYPPVPVELVLADEWQRRFTSYFLDSGEYAADPFLIEESTERPQTRCVSVCLFKQCVDNKYPGQFPIDEGRWRSKYWEGLVGLAGEMASLPDWKLRIYAEKDLWAQTCAAFGTHPQVELRKMAVNSVGATPGAMWRFLALADSSLVLAAVADIDESLAGQFHHVTSLEADAGSILARYGDFASTHKLLVAPGQTLSRNYAVIQGGRVACRPARFGFDIAAAMRGFMAYRRFRSMSDRPWAYASDDVLNAYNVPHGDHVHGWGSHWHMYCFDERFLKHVLYYHFARMGNLHTWTGNFSPDRMMRERLLDLRHVWDRRNTIASPDGVRVRPAGMMRASERGP